MAKSKVRIKIRHPGSLKRYGYDPDYSEIARHRALSTAVRRLGYQKVVQKLNAVRVLTKTKDKRHSRIYAKDLRWLRAHFKAR